MQASIRQRELCPLFSGGIQTSREPLAHAADDFDGLLGITACRHRPQDIKLAGGIDIIVHHHHEAAVVGAAREPGTRETELAASDRDRLV